MDKRHISLLLISTTIAFVLVAGCTSPTQSNVAPANLTENASTSASTTASSTVSPAPTLSPSPSPSVTVTPSASPMPSPSPSGKIATAVDAGAFFFTDNTVTRGTAKTTWAFNVVAQGTQSHILCGVPLTALIDGRPAGTLTPQSGPDCFMTANYELSAKETAGLSVGTHTLTIRYAGDNTYQPSEFADTFDVA